MLHLKGRVILHNLKMASVVLGGNDAGIVNPKTNRGAWRLDDGGIIEFAGKCSIHTGCLISCSSSGHIIFGNCSSMNVNSRILCSNKISIGDYVSISWECLIMDNDWHSILHGSSKKERIGSIYIGNHVWICCRCIILKGTTIGDNSVIAAGTKVTKKFGNNTLVGNSNKKLMGNIDWEE